MLWTRAACPISTRSTWAPAIMPPLGCADPRQVDEASDLLLDEEGLFALDACRDDADAGLDEVLDHPDIFDECPRQRVEVGRPAERSGPAGEDAVFGHDLLEDPRLDRKVLRRAPLYL